MEYKNLGRERECDFIVSKLWLLLKDEIKQPAVYFYNKRLKSAVEKLIELCDNTKQQYVSEIWQLRIGVVKQVLAELDFSRSKIRNNSKYGFYCQRDIEGDECCDVQCQHCGEYYDKYILGDIK